MGVWVWGSGVPAVVCAVVAICALAGCGSGGPVEASPGSAPPTPSATSEQQPPPPLEPAGTPSQEATREAGATDVPRRSVRQRPLRGVTIVLDPGHNGRNYAFPAQINRSVDAGGFEKPCNTTGTATDGGYSEAAAMWGLAQVLERRLVRLGADVVLTRDSDDGWGPCVDERGRTASRAGADVLVSLHGDGSTDRSAHGFHVIHPGEVPGYTDGIVEPSARLATDLRDALVARGFTPSTYLGVGGLDQRADLGTLNHARVPAVMLEAGNMRNPADAALLTSPDGWRRLSGAVSDGLVAFLG